MNHFICLDLKKKGKETKRGKLLTSHRYNLLPLLRSRPGGFRGSWSYKTYPSAKIVIRYDSTSVLEEYFLIFYFNIGQYLLNCLCFIKVVQKFMENSVYNSVRTRSA